MKLYIIPHPVKGAPGGMFRNESGHPLALWNGDRNDALAEARRKWPGAEIVLCNAKGNAEKSKK